MEKLRIAVVSSSVHQADPSRYGSEAQNAFLVKALRGFGCEVIFIAPPKSLYATHLIPWSRGEVSIADEKLAYDWYREELLNADYIIDWSATCRVAEKFYFWERKRYKGVVVWNRNGVGFDFPRPPASSYWHGVCLSNLAREEARKWDIPLEKLHVIHYGIDIDIYKPAPNPSRDYWLYLSRPHPDKGVFTFLQLAKRHPEEKFVVAFQMASKDHEYWGRKVIEEARSLRNVELVLNPSLEDKVKLYSNAKALVVPLSENYAEAFGLVSAEALSCGTPIIYGKRSGIFEVAVDGVHGFAVNSSVEDVEKAMKRIDEVDPRECRRLAEEKLNLKLWATKYVELYYEIRGELK